MDRTISSVFLAVGILLVLLSITEAESLASDISTFINGNSMDESVWLMVTGSVVSLIGITGLMRNRKRDLIDENHH